MPTRNGNGQAAVSDTALLFRHHSVTHPYKQNYKILLCNQKKIRYNILQQNNTNIEYYHWTKAKLIRQVCQPASRVRLELQLRPCFDVIKNCHEKPELTTNQCKNKQVIRT